MGRFLFLRCCLHDGGMKLLLSIDQISSIDIIVEDFSWEVLLDTVRL